MKHWNLRAFARRGALFASAALALTASAVAQELGPPSPPIAESEFFESDAPQNVEEQQLADAAGVEASPAAYERSSVMMEMLEAPPGAGAAAAKPKAKKKAPPPNPYKPLFYDNDFKYLDDPKDKSPRFWGDSMKRIDLTDCMKMDVGGEYRLRQHNENHLRGSNLSGRNDNFLLERTRLYVNVEQGCFRFYGEAIDAISDFERYQARTIEENRWDALNLFGDLRLFKGDDGETLKFRGGRQEMLYGEQRLVSPLDWANTRRTFDGFDLIWRSKNWSVDAFLTRPVGFGQHVNLDHNFDHPDESQDFMGVYTSYKGFKNNVVDAYFLRLSESDGVASRFTAASFNANLFGARWAGTFDEVWKVDCEGGYQFGSWDGLSTRAGFVTLGLGHVFKDAKTKPTLFTYWDYASGDSNPNDNIHGTFNQLFPLGHKYFGFADLVARQNIQDLNFQLTGEFSKKWKYLVWQHVFWLNQSEDALYNANGVPIRAPVPGAGNMVGTELDLLLTYTHDARTDVQFGYSRFFAGHFVHATNPVGVSGDVDFFYLQASRRF